MTVPLNFSYLEVHLFVSLLTLVIYHHGTSATGGHYTADVLLQDGRNWLNLDDTKLKWVDAGEVAVSEEGGNWGEVDHVNGDEGGGWNHIKGKVAYILLYKRVYGVESAANLREAKSSIPNDRRSDFQHEIVSHKFRGNGQQSTTNTVKQVLSKDKTGHENILRGGMEATTTTNVSSGSSVVEGPNTNPKIITTNVQQIATDTATVIPSNLVDTDEITTNKKIATLSGKVPNGISCSSAFANLTGICKTDGGTEIETIERGTFQNLSSFHSSA